MSENKNNENIEDLDNDFLNFGLDSNNELDFNAIESYLNVSEDKSKPVEDKPLEKPSKPISSSDLLIQLLGTSPKKDKIEEKVENSEIPTKVEYIISQFQENDLNAFKISSSSDSAKLEDNTKDTIHIGVGSSTYGWNVSFSNGVVMSLNDVRIYQSRNKKLLDNSGKITYGSKIFEFSNIRKIIFYETPKYFSYTKLK